MAVSLETIVRQIEASGLVAPDALREFLPPAGAPQDVGAFLRALIKREKLTKFQAEQFVAGRSQSLFVGAYTLLEKIGAGGMGQVYKAQHRRMNRIVAIKVLPQAKKKDAVAEARFQREAEASAKLSHPNIVAAFDAGEANGTHYLVMEYIEGSDLSVLVKKFGRFAVDNAVDHITQAARGLAYAHSQGVVHRDIKPANLLFDRTGVLRILDMGIARLADAAATDDQLTQSGTVMGTADYMAPEQATDIRHADARSDVYSLGCTLYSILAGESVFEASSVVQKVMAHINKPTPLLSAKRPDVPPELERIFQKMMAKSPDDRYQNAGELVDDLERFRAQRATGNASGVDGSVAISLPTANTTPAPRKQIEDGATDLFGYQRLRRIYEPEPTANLSQPIVDTSVSGASLSQIEQESGLATTKTSPWKMLIGAGIAALSLLALGVWMLM